MLYILAVSALYGFRGIKIGEVKLVNKVASAVFGIYIFHQCIIFREGNSILWNQILCIENKFSAGYEYILYTTISIFVVYLISLILSLVIMRFVEAIVNLKSVSKRCQIIDKYINYI